MKIVLTYTIAWLGLVLLAILNGILRERGFGPLMSELSAHQLSTVSGIIIFASYIWSLTGLFRIPSQGHAILIGLIWLAMTVVFEFVFGNYVMGHDPREIWYTRVAKEREFGECDINKIEINKILDNGEILPIRNISEIKRHPLGLNWARKKDPSERLFW